MKFLRRNPIQHLPDLCQTSISMLGQKIRPFLESKFSSENVWIPDEATQFNNSSAVVDTVFLGGFLNRFFEMGNWPDENYRLWTCSQAAREVMIKQLGFSEQEIGLICRYDLFPASNLPLKELDLKDADFVFAGRLSPTKNLESLIWTVYYLQKKYGYNVRLHLFGDSDNMIGADRGHWEIEQYGQILEGLIEKLDWKIKPRLYGKVGAEAWLQYSFKNPVLVNLSTFICEDFDVSLAQAQQIGWPHIISDWGGHRDQKLANGISIPWKLVGRSDESNSTIKLKAEVLAKFLTEEKPAKTLTNTQTIVPTLTVNRARLDSLRAAVIKKIGPDSFHLSKANFAAFAETKTGSAFFSIYRSFFGGSKNVKKVIITNDLNKQPDQLNQSIFHKTFELARDEELSILIPSRELLWPENRFYLSQATEIHFTFKDQSTHKLASFIKELVAKDCRIQIHSSPELVLASEV